MKPLTKFADAEAAMVARDLGQRLGHGVSQNAAGDTLGHAPQPGWSRRDGIRLNALPLVLLEEARAAADAADAAQRSGATLGPLHGVPVSIKINIDQRGQPNDNGVVAFRNAIAAEDSPVVANLRRADAIPFTRSNSPAFALRGHTDNDLHGATRNPRDPGLVSGGSIRGPSYVNGIVGLRPTPDRVPHVNPSATVARPLSTQLMSVPVPWLVACATRGWAWRR